MKSIYLLIIFIGYIHGNEKPRDVNDLQYRLQKNAKRPPWPNGGKTKPLDVRIGIYVESLGKFKSTEMSFDVDLYLYMSWRDYTLNHTNRDYVLINDPKVREHIWLPDLYFANARTAFFHDVTIPNFNLFISRDGTIAYSSRVTLTVACNLQLAKYPMDQQNCEIRILSYAYIANQVNVTWFTINPIRYNPEMSLPEFSINTIVDTYCDGTYMYAIMDTSHKIDKFSCLEAVIRLKRSLGYHLVQSYIPTALIVFISWVSFWIDRRAVPARVTLSFTTLLSLSTLGNGLRFGLPMVSYAKAIDYWFGICMIFVFLALLEFALVNSYMRQANKFEKLSKALEKRQISIESDPEDTGPYIPSNFHKHSYHLINNDKTKNSEQNNSRDFEIPLASFNTKKKIALSQSSSSLKGNQVSNQEYTPVSIYSNTGSPQMNQQNDRIPVLATFDLDDSMTMSQTHSIHNQNQTNAVNKNIDESPTKTTFVSDDEWTEQTPVFHSRIGKRKIRHHRENKTAGVNQFVHLGFIYSRKALRIDKLSRILFPANFTIFCSLYWFYYLVYIPKSFET